ncbi:DUF5723 family protein [Gracilimonas sp. Q87]|uniref:DUF5723 family protein n=1 Tax=Gracilimonas sp. Q87 TaxID=3384766 RepID=UPI003983F696
MKQFLTALLIVLTGFSLGMAQPVLTPLNMALGGGGSTYVTDFNANFYNPANLLILEHERGLSVGIGVAGIYSDQLINYTSFSTQISSIKDHFDVYKPGNFKIDNTLREQIINDNYPGRNTLSDNRVRSDITIAGVKWHRNDRSYAIALRSRSSTSFRVGLGWYDLDYKTNSSNDNIVDRSLIYRRQSMYEISFGYSESFQFLTGLTSRLDNFIIGIAPKVVIGTEYENAVWKNVYSSLDGSATARRIQSFNYSATGEHTSAISRYLTGNSVTSSNQVFSKDPFDINGIGAGLDIGVTYLVSLGSDLSAIRRDGQPTRRSLRLSFSMTDIGLVSYSSNDISISSPVDSTQNITVPVTTATESFGGSKGQYLHFIDMFAESDPFNSNTENNKNKFSVLLPMALHSGALLEINRLKLMADISVGLTNNAFNSTKLKSSFGMELRPISFLPIRGGIRFEAQRPDFISFGTAIETERFNISIATILKPNSLSERPSLTGAVVSALRIHF